MLRKLRYTGQEILFWRNREKTNEEVFREIYTKHLWDEGTGNKKEEFYSGRGSDDIYGNVYAEIILRFMEENGMGGVLRKLWIWDAEILGLLQSLPANVKNI